RLLGGEHHPAPRNLRPGIGRLDAAAIDLDATVAVAEHQLPVGSKRRPGGVGEQQGSEERAERAHGHRIVEGDSMLIDLCAQILSTLPRPGAYSIFARSRWGCPPRTG